MLTQYSPRFGDTIVAETDDTNTIATGSSGAACLRSMSNGATTLREEVRALQIRAKHLFEARFGRLQQIRAYARRAAGVVDERVQAAVVRFDALDEPVAMPRGWRRPPRRRSTSAPSAFKLIHDGLHLGGRAEPRQREVPAACRERARDAEPDAARAARDERHRTRVGPALVTRRLLGGAEEGQVRLVPGDPLDVERGLAAW